jgi:hypothetical protein
MIPFGADALNELVPVALKGGIDFPGGGHAIYLEDGRMVVFQTGYLVGVEESTDIRTRLERTLAREGATLSTLGRKDEKAAADSAFQAAVFGEESPTAHEEVAAAPRPSLKDLREQVALDEAPQAGGVYDQEAM